MCLAMNECRLYNACFRAVREQQPGVGMLECGKIRKFFGNRRVAYKVFLRGLEVLLERAYWEKGEKGKSNAEGKLAYQRRYYWEHREEIRAKRTGNDGVDYEQKRQRRLEYQRKWRAEHKEYFRKYYLEHRAKGLKGEGVKGRFVV